MEQRSCNAYVIRTRTRRPRIFVEDDSLDLTTLDLCPPGAGAFEITVCKGPEGTDICPLVTRGVCPAGVPDVVVSALGEANPWRVSVHAAWELEGVPVAELDNETPLVWPAHVGAAIRTFFRDNADDD